MAKLWDKGIDLNEEVEDYTVGSDFLLDCALVPYDVYASIAHAKMLAKIGVLEKEELASLTKALCDVLALHEAGRFMVEKKDEDVHTAIENYLVGKLGEIGKRIHAGRSRNDQVLVDLRLYMKEALLDLSESLIELANDLAEFAEKHKSVPLVGRTHTQKAMPGSVGLWAGSFAESIIDSLVMVDAAYTLADQCPLGSGAGFGSALKIDREYTSKLLGFSKVQGNVLYCANSRGKIEGASLSACLQVMNDLSRLASDIIFGSIPETGYFSLPNELFSGSSMMPQKKNPDLLELVRGNASVVLGYLMQVSSLSSGLISGYSRDMQLTKEPLIRGVETTISSVRIIALTVKKLSVDKKKCVDAFTPEVFATDEALRLVAKGVPFRDAYKKVGENLSKLKKEDPVKNIKSKKHTGATGNLGLEKVKKALSAEKTKVGKTIKAFRETLDKLQK